MAKKIDCSELSLTLTKMAMNLGSRKHIKDLDSVVTEMQTYVPQVTREVLVDAINETVDTSSRKTSEEALKWRQLRGEAVSEKKLRSGLDKKLSHGLDKVSLALEAEAARTKPSHKPSPVLKALQALKHDVDQQEKTQSRIDSVKRAISRKEALEAKQHKARPASAKLKEMRAELGELTRQEKASARIREIKKATAPKSKRKATPPSETVAALRAEANDLAQRKKVQARIKEIKKAIATGTTIDTDRKTKPASKELAALREERDELTKKLGRTDPALIKKIGRSIDKLEKQLEMGTFKAPAALESKSDKVTNKELTRVQYREHKLKTEINRQIKVLQPKSMMDRFADPFNAGRALMTSLDFSGVGRQGIIIGLAHPIRSAKSIMPMLKATVSKKKAYEINRDILESHNAPLYWRYGLYLAAVDGGTLSQREEAYMTSWAERIPGVAASERAYVTYLNKIRADTFDAMIATLSRNKNGEVTQAEGEAIANFVNVATGRGNLGALEKAAVPLNTIFFAPKYVASRFQFAMGQPLMKGPNSTRKMIAAEYARFLIGAGVVAGLGLAAGGDVEDDLRSADFGKIRFGDTRIDLMGGLSQTIVLVARVVSGKTKSTGSGKIYKIRGNTRFGGRDTADVLASFGRSKLSPMFSTFIDTATGTDVIGQPVTLWSEITGYAPLALRDVYDAIIAQGLPAGTALGLTAIMGGGLQTYESRGKKASPARRTRKTR